MKLEFVRTESETPSHTHGGYACHITWELTLNGVVIGTEGDRYPWEKRKESSLKPHWVLQKLHDSIVEAISSDSNKIISVKPGFVYKHLKRGTLYVVVDEARIAGGSTLEDDDFAIYVDAKTGKYVSTNLDWLNAYSDIDPQIVRIQASKKLGYDEKMVVYRCLTSGNLWARTVEEFTDGRFIVATVEQSS